MSDAVVLLSGGLDSSTCLAVATRDCERVAALTIDYGQRHRIELDAARRVVRSYPHVEHIIQSLPLNFPGSALTDANVDVPTSASDGVPVTYVPARNIIFLSLAAGWAEALDADRIYIGVSAIDYSGYPDCRPGFIRAMQAALSVGQQHAPEIVAPLLHLSKVETIRLGESLGVDYAATHSCYAPVNGQPCGRCDSCRIRADAFAAAG